MPAKQWMKPVARPVATIESVKAHIASGNLAAAAVAIRQVYEREPTPESAEQYRSVLSMQIDLAIQRKDSAEFERVLKLSEKTLPKHRASMLDRAISLARWGMLPQGLMQLPADATEAERLEVLGHAADRAIRYRSSTGLPDEHHKACKNVILAFAKYQRGDDDAARALIQDIGLQSPFLDWKLLLRGLMAYTANDDVKALENWKRLAKARLPVRLTWPFRIHFEEEYQKQIAPQFTQALHLQSRELIGGRTQAPIQALQQIIGQNVSLQTAWPKIEAAWSILKPSHPALATRLAKCIYHAIARQGQPDDLPRYRRIFGQPADDPDFHRLQAMVLESQGQLLAAIEFWEKYERWLGTSPAGWDPVFLKRARAALLTHIGELCEDASLDDEGEGFGDLLEMFEAMMRKGGRMPPKARPKYSPRHYFEKAIVVDPEAASPRRALVTHLAESNDADGLVAAANAALTVLPDDPAILTTIADSLHSRKRAIEALPYRLRALAVNPLDPHQMRFAAITLVSACRQNLEAGDAHAALKLLDQHPELAANLPVEAPAFRSVIFRKLGRRELAIDNQEQAFAQRHGRLAAALYLSADATLAGLKAPEKTYFNKLLTDALKQPATFEEILALHAAYFSYGVGGFEFRGQKTFDKKIEKLLNDALQPNQSPETVEAMLAALRLFDNAKMVLKLADKLITYYPTNVRVRLLWVRILSRGRATRTQEQRARRELHVCRGIIATQNPANKAELLTELEELHRHYAHPFDSFFGGSDEYL